MKNITSQEQDATKKIMVLDDNDRILWDCGSPLYDSYELVSLTHIIERHFMSLPGIGKAYNSSRTPSDLGAKGDIRAASTVVDLCCASDSKSGRLFCRVFGTKWWKKKVFCRIMISLVRIPTTRFGTSPKM